MFNVGTLLAARITDGFPMATLLGSDYAWLDGYRGVMRWHICYNLTVLRMLSFGLDLHWSRRTNNSNVAKQQPKNAKERQWSALPSPQQDYSLLFALAHALYTPLYLAGPIITYQDFVWQLKQQSKSDKDDTNNSKKEVNNNTYSTLKTAKLYIWRLAADFICIELVTHFLYFNSLAVHKIGKRYAQYGLKFTA